MERYCYSNFSRGSTKENFCEYILKSGYWSRRSCSLKVFLVLALAAILFRVAEGFEQFW